MILDITVGNGCRRWLRYLFEEIGSRNVREVSVLACAAEGTGLLMFAARGKSGFAGWNNRPVARWVEFRNDFGPRSDTGGRI